MLRAYNVIVTNVRGPEFPLYLLGSRLLAIYPLVPLFGYDTLGGAIVSYEDRLFVGLSGDVAGDTELTRFSEDVHAAFDALRDEFSARSSPMPPKKQAE